MEGIFEGSKQKEFLLYKRQHGTCRKCSAGNSRVSLFVCMRVSGRNLLCIIRVTSLIKLKLHRNATCTFPFIISG